MINHIPQNTVVMLWCVITHPCRKFWQVFNLRLTFHLSVCLFVCLFVTLSHHISRTNRQIITKHGPHMVLGPAQRLIVFGVVDVTDDVIRSKNRSNFEIVISQAIFKIQHRNKN